MRSINRDAIFQTLHCHLFFFICGVKVLLIHQHFKTPYKGGAIRSYYLAKGLVDNGVQTIVITAHNKDRYTVEDVDGIEVHYLPIAYNNRFGFLQRVLSFMRFVKGAVRTAGKFRDAELCYAISVPLTVGIAARRIVSRYNIPFVFEVGDLWPEAPVQMGIIRNPILKKILYDLERKIYTSARAVVALSPAIESEIRKKVNQPDVFLIPNISDTDFFKPQEKDPGLVERFGVENKFVVSYTGAIGYANDLDQMLACAKASDEAKLPVHIVMCGDGAYLDHLKNEIVRLNLHNFSIIPFTNREGVREILNVTDATFISYRPVPVLETGSPNKYFDGLAAGKLIIVNFGGWIREEIESNQCGIFINPRDPEDFIRKIKPFITDSHLLKAHQQSARSLAERKYSRTLLTQKFVQIIKNQLPR